MQRLMHHKKITKLPNLEMVGSAIVIRRVTRPITTGKNEDKLINADLDQGLDQWFANRETIS